MASSYNILNHMGLNCAECGGMTTRVTDVRRHNKTIRRRRMCVNCKHRFYTKEVVCDIQCKELKQ